MSSTGTGISVAWITENCADHINRSDHGVNKNAGRIYRCKNAHWCIHVQPVVLRKLEALSGIRKRAGETI